MDAPYITVPRLARMLGVSPPAVRYWIKAGWIERPARLDSSTSVVFDHHAAIAIRAWYRLRSAAGLTRGIGADEKQRRALAELASLDRPT